MKMQIIRAIVFCCAIVTSEVCVSLSAQNSARALYVYENGCDTAFNVTPILFSDIDSIRFSCIDEDSVVCPVPVVQEIWTPNQVYRISLEKIDSVCFNPLPTILQPRAVDLTQQPLRDCVESVSMDDMTVTFVKDIPSHLLPTVGEYLFALECGNQFGGGFIGQVTAMNHTADAVIAQCVDCELTDVFEQYYGAFEAEVTNDGVNDAESVGGDISERDYPAARSRARDIPDAADGEFRLKPKHIQISEDSLNIKVLDDCIKVLKRINSVDKDEDSPISPKVGVDAYLTPSVRVKQFFMISPRHFRHQIDVDLSVGMDANMFFGGQIERNMTMKADVIKLPVAIPLLMAGLEIGAEFNASATGGIRLIRKGDFKLSYQYTSTSPGLMGKAKTGGIKFIPKYGKNDLVLDGNVSLIGFVTSKLTLAHKSLASISGKLFCGVEARGNYTFTLKEFDNADKDSSFYSRLKDCGWSIGRVLGFELSGSLLGFESMLYQMPVRYTEWAKSRVVPQMKQKVVATDPVNNSTNVVVRVDGVVDAPRTVGIKVVNNEGLDNEETFVVTSDTPYECSGEGNRAEYAHKLPFELTKDSRLYPIVDYYEKMVQGAPFLFDINSQLFHPFTSYMSNENDCVRMISGASLVGVGESEYSVAQVGNWLPFYYFDQENDNREIGKE